MAKTDPQRDAEDPEQDLDPPPAIVPEDNLGLGPGTDRVADVASEDANNRAGPDDAQESRSADINAEAAPPSEGIPDPTSPVHVDSEEPTPVEAGTEPEDISGVLCKPGLFGKLPARGDFVARGLNRDLIRSLEDWLLPLVQETRDLVGRDWAAIWQQAPAWRFWIGPGVLGGEWQREFRGHARSARGVITGVMLPSMDRRGRFFPLVLVLADSHARLMPPPVLFAPDRRWYASCDRLLYAARDGRDMDGVETDLATVDAPRLPDMASDMEELLLQQSLWAQGAAHDDSGDGDVWADIRASDHHLAAVNRSYWWAEAAGDSAAAGPTSVLSLSGLPDAQTFAFMLTDAVPRPAQESDTT